MAEYDGVPEREDYKHGGDNELGKNGGYGSAHNTHGRERTCSEDQDRIQHHVDDQPVRVAVREFRLFPAAVKIPVNVWFKKENRTQPQVICR